MAPGAYQPNLQGEDQIEGLQEDFFENVVVQDQFPRKRHRRRKIDKDIYSFDDYRTCNRHETKYFKQETWKFLYQLRYQKKHHSDHSDFVDNSVKLLFPGLLEKLSELETKVFKRKVQVALMSHLNKDVYPFLKQLSQKDFQVYRDASFKHSIEAQKLKLDDVVFGFLTRLFQISDRAIDYINEVRHKSQKQKKTLNADVVKKLGEEAMQRLLEKTEKNSLAKKLVAYLIDFEKQQTKTL